MGLIASGLYEVGRSWHGAMHQEVDFVDRTIVRDGVPYHTWYRPIGLNGPGLLWKNYSWTYDRRDFENVESRKENHGEEGQALRPISDFIVPAPVDPDTGHTSCGPV